MDVRMRWYSLAIFVGTAIATPGLSQSTGRLPFAVSAQASAIPLYGGDAAVGRSLGLGPSLRLAYAPPFARGHALVEAYGTRTFAGRAHPTLLSLGVTLGAALGSATGPVRGLLLAGIGRLHVESDQDGSCLPPQCFFEGPHFVDAHLTTFVGGVGVVAPSIDRLAFRADLRIHAPLSPDAALFDSGSTRFELALGLLIRW